MRFPTAGHFLAGPGRRRKANPDGSMTLMEHLYELRYRLFVALSAIALGGVLGFLWWGMSPFGLPSLGDLITRPCGVHRADLDVPGVGVHHTRSL
jgi:hypothetical protein